MKITAITIVLVFIILGCKTFYQEGNEDNITLPGKYENYTLLPNGWKLSPAGEQVGIDDLPLNMIVTNDEKYALTSNSGTKDNSISVIDLSKNKEIQRVIVDKTWRGIVFNNDDSKLYVSGANNNQIYIYDFVSGKLTLKDSIIIGVKYPKEKISITGIDYLSNKNLLLAVSRMSNSLYACDLHEKKVIKVIHFDSECYDVKINHNQTFAYVSLWANSSIAEVDLSTLSVSNLIKVGDHPNEIIITKNDKRLFVANANNNSISNVDLVSKKETERIITSLNPEVPYGSTPNAICFNNDESVLIAANADNNYLALFDISKNDNAKSLGFIPVGWYPTSVKMSSSNKLIVANGKGITSKPNPNGPQPTKGSNKENGEFIAYLLNGTVSIINYPNEATLKLYSQRVFSNTPYIETKKYIANQDVIPDEHNGVKSGKIKHVFYIIKENRTYDQVYGDISKGNGDSSICIFGKIITPNQHKLADEFTLFDNFYCDAEVSADGHNWSTAAYATDFTEKTWPTYYGGRGGNYDYEGGSKVARPTSGYIWDDVINKKLFLRNYGEFVWRVVKQDTLYQPPDEDLKNYTCETYPGFDLNISDLFRYKIWEKDFDELAAKDSIPSLSVIRLPNDHTWGTSKGKLTPQAYVAQNDYALGLMVEKISHSKYWNESIIFVLEDDAQNGPDHVDAHRSTFLVISPYVKRNFVDHTMYSTSGVLKTIELILGLKPMTQYDLSATPILYPISNEPDSSVFSSLKPLINIETKNSDNAYGSERSSEMNFVTEDAIPDIELNEIIWKSIKGAKSTMPPPVRSAFVLESD
jgi:DNA-binding beta-propeller fold protein YncE